MATELLSRVAATILTPNLVDKTSTRKSNSLIREVTVTFWNYPFIINISYTHHKSFSNICSAVKYNRDCPALDGINWHRCELSQCPPASNKWWILHRGTPAFICSLTTLTRYTNRIWQSFSNKVCWFIILFLMLQQWLAPLLLWIKCNFVCYVILI